ncbi:MAG: GNAT family N-acetyltransferase [Chromatiales bacterium]|jgi:GNAT superfamily N-acetyltransferase
MIVETAKETEMQVLCALFNQARMQNSSFPKVEYNFADFLQVVEGEQVFVARIAGDIAGFASVWEPENFLHHLYVSPLHQRQGIGGELLKHCVNMFGLPMSLKCIEANVEACHFYEKFGWRIAEKAKGPEGRYLLYVKEGNA